MEHNFINKAVKELLDKICNHLQGYRWDSLCGFSDGKGLTLIELNLFRKDGQEMAGRIAYQLETGLVLRFYYPAFTGNAPEDILDFLLDVLNLESQIHATKAALEKGK